MTLISDSELAGQMALNVSEKRNSPHLGRDRLGYASARTTWADIQAWKDSVAASVCLFSGRTMK